MADEKAAAPAVFEPGPRTRTREYLIAAGFMLAVLLITVLLGLRAMDVLVVEAAVLDPDVARYTFGVVLLLSVWVGWRCVQGRLQFTIEITPTQVHFGRGLLRRSMDCDEIETVRVRRNPEARGGPAQWLEVRAGGTHRRVCLDGAEPTCAELLYRRCPNAVYIDADGREHRPPTGERPLALLGSLARGRVRRGWRTAAMSLIFLVWGLPVMGVFAGQLLFGRQRWDAFLDPRVGFVLVMTVIGLVILLVGVGRVRRARQLVAQARELEQGAAERAPS